MTRKERSNIRLRQVPTDGALKWLAGKKLAFFGDSITADLRTNYVTLVVDALADAIDASSIAVTNSGVDSSSIVDALDRLPDVLLEHDPDVVVAFVGVNDSKIFRNIGRPLLTVRVFEESYRAFLQALDARRVRHKVLLTLPPLCFREIEQGSFLAEYWYWKPKLYAEYNRAILRAGRRPCCAVADLSSGFVGAAAGRKRLFHDDGVHPNIYGHRVIANSVLMALRRLGRRGVNGRGRTV